MTFKHLNELLYIWNRWIFSSNCVCLLKGLTIWTYRRIKFLHLGIYKYKIFSKLERNGEGKMRGRRGLYGRWLFKQSLSVWSAEVISQALYSIVDSNYQMGTGQVINFPAVKHCPRWSVCVCTQVSRYCYPLHYLYHFSTQMHVQSRELIFDVRSDWLKITWLIL